MDKKVRIYTTPTCPYCIRAKEFLSQNKIAFENIDLSSGVDAVEELIQKTGQMGVPVFDIDGTIIVGFDQQRLRQELGI